LSAFFYAKFLAGITRVDEFQQLREQRMRESTREFRARGKSVVRCEKCQLADFACICTWIHSQASAADFVVLMHRKEVFKPTNTGRFLAQLFPDNCRVFAWDRTQPDPQLLELLADPRRECLLVYPCEQPERQTSVHPTNEKRLTFILLDGTWKQSGRMFHLSEWLKTIKAVALPERRRRGYTVRQSHQENYLSTLEAAGVCLQLTGDERAGNYCLDFFDLFNQHYLATRGCYPPVPGELHAKLSGQLLNATSGAGATSD